MIRVCISSMLSRICTNSHIDQHMHVLCLYKNNLLLVCFCSLLKLLWLSAWIASSLTSDCKENFKRNNEDCIAHHCIKLCSKHDIDVKCHGMHVGNASKEKEEDM